jgi:universal stress protein E
MNRISHILVVVDPSTRRRQAAVDKAAHLARCSHASVELMICDIASALNDQLAPADRRAHPNNTELLNLLDELAVPLRCEGTDVTLRIIYGKSLPDALLDYIRGSNADLVIKDAHTHSTAKRTFTRNTDWHLARGCSIPLLLTKRGPWGERPALITTVALSPVDEQAEASIHHVLDFSASITRHLNGDLHIINTYIPTAFAAIVSAGRQSVSREYIEAVQVENSFRQCQLVSLGNEYGVSPTHVHVEMGAPHDCLKHVVKAIHADVVVVSASSPSWYRVFIGSTAATLLESLDCDVLIIGSSEFTTSHPT